MGQDTGLSVARLSLATQNVREVCKFSYSYKTSKPIQCKESKVITKLRYWAYISSSALQATTIMDQGVKAQTTTSGLSDDATVSVSVKHC